ncbi:putative aminopeptidase FrvX [Bradyrhizobium diazoefficiens]|uniref:M28 family peptidase n=1 Tax=Bradyrhizobium diazoefficiens TaxID=1355477 RepID=UPI003512F52A
MSEVETIKKMLEYKRPAGSKAEAAFIHEFITPLGAKRDAFGNQVLVVGDENPAWLWSCHTDSVHTKHGKQIVAQTGKFLHLPEKSRSNCLGADDAAGVWVMSEMIKAKVPGLYVFHAAEEIGCKGSRAIATMQPDFLANIKAAIAFDRRGIDSVITHQGSRCCSDNFGKSLAAQLPKRFKLDPTGVLTDTKMYMKIVPECTNISVGYYSEHSENERLDVDHLIELRDHMVSIDPTSFVIERDPKLEPPAPKYKGGTSSKILQQLSLLRERREESIYDLVYWHPKIVAELLQDAGITYEDLKDHIEASGTPAFDYGDYEPIVA